MAGRAKRRLYVFCTCLMILVSGCYPTPCEQDASEISGRILRGSEPLANAQIAIGEGLGSSCIDWRQIFSGVDSVGSHTVELDKQPYSLNDTVRLAIPIVTATDEDGQFYVSVRSSPGFVWLSKEKYWRSTFCIVLDGDTVYEVRSSYSVSHQRCKEIEFHCDVDDLANCDGRPRMIGVYASC